MKNKCLSLLPGQKGWKDYGRPNLAEVPDSVRTPAPALLSDARSKDLALDVLTNAVGISRDNPTRIVNTPVEKVILRRELLEHVVQQRTDKRERYSNFLLPTLEDPYEVWLAQYSDSGLRTHYIGLYQDYRDMMAVVRIGKDGSLIWNLIRSGEKWLNNRRAGTLLFGR
ncbi:MAG: hypothetical protein HQL57_07510 [Magnetococcales bacterium]|nr:hypothetical protein [Magnetococcales bacterium]MBF0157013.1 hypothetical protein [Magnetococcales bacterium]